MALLSDIKEILTGLAITFGHIFKKPATIQYPEQKRVMPARFHPICNFTKLSC